MARTRFAGLADRSQLVVGLWRCHDKLHVRVRKDQRDGWYHLTFEGYIRRQSAPHRIVMSNDPINQSAPSDVTGLNGPCDAFFRQEGFVRGSRRALTTIAPPN